MAPPNRPAGSASAYYDSDSGFLNDSDSNSYLLSNPTTGLTALHPRPRADPAGRLGGGGNWSGHQPNLAPKSDFSSDFGHFILKIRKIKNKKLQNYFVIVKNFSFLGGRMALSEPLGGAWPLWPPIDLSLSKADPAGRFGGGGQLVGLQPNLPPKSDFSSDFDHFILKIRKIKNKKFSIFYC